MRSGVSTHGRRHRPALRRLVPALRGDATAGGVSLPVLNRLHRRAAKRGVLVGATLGARGTPAPRRAQELWLVPDAFAFASGSTIAATARLLASGSRAGVLLRSAMIGDVRILGSGGEARVGDLSLGGRVFRLRHRPQHPGQYVIAVALEPRTVRTTQTQFVRWLRAQAAASEAARLEPEPAFAPTDSVTYRSVSYPTANRRCRAGPAHSSAPPASRLTSSRSWTRQVPLLATPWHSRGDRRESAVRDARACGARA